eukprot:scaffold75307_cov62-Cyclotella_meneghiniana.AAC.1
MCSGSIWIGEKLRAHAQFSQFSQFFVYGYLLDIKIAANSPFFWHRSGIVLASWHRLWHRLWHRSGIVLASLQPKPATKSVNNKKATSDNRSHQPAIKAARTNDDNQLFIDGKENGVPMVTAYIKPINQTEWKIQP